MNCTCGIYHSVIPPGPCPMHAPMEYLQYQMVLDYMRIHKTTNTNKIAF